MADDWRHAIVTPIAKAPRTAYPNLFKPISLTSVVCEALEAFLKEKMLAHLSQFSSLTSCQQHSFLLRRSTLTSFFAAEELITTWLDVGSSVDLTYLDLSKAFDSVNHRHLLHKRRGYSIAPIVISWVECFLSRRTFQVNVNGTSMMP